jgi:group I intron endonuclease
MTSTGFIYKIKNNCNSNFYIGQTISSLSKRFTSHLCASKHIENDTVLCRAIRKYGSESFYIEEVEKIETPSKEETKVKLNEREQFYIAELKPEYNMAPGGLGHTGSVWTEERKQIFKEKMSGSNNHNFNKPLSDETKKKLSTALKGRVISNETRIKTSLTMKGKTKKEETRQKMKIAQQLIKDKINRPKGLYHKASKPVYQYDLNKKLIHKYVNSREAALKLKIQTSGISMCCKGKLQTCGGFIWSFEPIE